MTDLRVTQGAALALEEGDADLNVTQAVPLALASGDAELRATQAATLALYGYAPPLNVTQVATLALVRGPNRLMGQSDLDDGCGQHESQCWKITRQDGTVHAFTTHDEDVTYKGTRYKRCDSLRASAISGTTLSGSATGDVQVQGILSEDAISAKDIYAGRFDNAKVEVHLVDWATGYGTVLTRGIICRTRQQENSYVLTALTGGARLEQQPLMEVFSPTCRWEFGSSQCGVDASALEVSSAVTGILAPNVAINRHRRQFTDAARVEAVEVYRNGRLTWTSGNNNGLTLEVKDIVGGVVTLWQPCPFNVQVGDAYTLRPGCGKTKSDCIDRYNNYENFGGFPDLPGNDAINLTPDRTA